MSPTPQARLRRRRSVVAVVLVLGLAAAGCGAKSEDAGKTPGYDGSGTTLDTRPFELAGPANGRGSTTLPDSYLQPGLRTTTSSTTAPPTTTTTAVSHDPEVPSVADIKSICGFERSIAPFEFLDEQAPAKVQTLMVGIVDVLARYRDVAPDLLHADLESIRSSFADLAQILAANGWNPRSGPYQAAFRAVQQQASKPDGLSSRMARVVEAEHATCS